MAETFVWDNLPTPYDFPAIKAEEENKRFDLSKDHLLFTVSKDGLTVFSCSLDKNDRMLAKDTYTISWLSDSDHLVPFYGFSSALSAYKVFDKCSLTFGDGHEAIKVLLFMNNDLTLQVISHKDIKINELKGLFKLWRSFIREHKEKLSRRKELQRLVVDGPYKKTVEELKELLDKHKRGIGLGVVGGSNQDLVNFLREYDVKDDSLQAFKQTVNYIIGLIIKNHYSGLKKIPSVVKFSVDNGLLSRRPESVGWVLDQSVFK